MKKVVCTALILGMLLPTPAVAAEVVLKNGRTLNGEIVRADGSGLVVKFVGRDVPTDVWDTGKLDGCAGARWSGNFNRELTIPWPCLAQGPPDSILSSMSPVDGDSSADDVLFKCDGRGRTEAESLPTGGSFTGGFLGGLFLGLIGTGIAVIAQSTPEPSYQQMQKLDSDDCRYAYSQAFKGKGKSKKQSAALNGGLAGTAVLVLVIVLANSGSQ